MTKECRSPKPETELLSEIFSLRISGFGIRISFGFRISDFGFVSSFVIRHSSFSNGMAEEIHSPLLSLIKEQNLIDDLQYEEVVGEYKRSGKPVIQILQDFG